MKKLIQKSGLPLLALVLFSSTSAAQVIDGASLAFRSSGTDSGDDWVLDENGYVGTYINLAESGEVTVTATAAGLAGGGADPHMNIVIADTKAGFDVGSGFNNYEHTFNLPAGTYFVRTEFNNSVPSANRELTVRSLSFDGATTSNSGNPSTKNDNAIAAANTYINNFRKGNVQVGLSGLTPGTMVDVRLKRHAFNFGTAVAGGGNDVNNYLGDATNPNSTAYQYQQAMAESKFNAIVPENAGKWSNNVSFFNPNTVTMANVDTILDFADAHDLRVRMHNLIWGSQQPNFVNTLIGQAQGGDMNAKDTLRAEISERIDYYVGDGVGADRAQRYYELDVYNESVHTPEYWDIYDADGIADIYNEVNQAVSNAGAETRLFANEYNVLQDSGDFYGNWYRQHIEEIRNAGGAVSGIGIQSYENDAIGTSFNAHYPSRKMQTLQNLSVLGMPITLTEFGVKDPTDQTDATTMLDDTARLVFGTPDASGFFMWGFWRGNIYRGAAALYDSNWNLTLPGERWQDLMSIDDDENPNDDWDTQLTAVVGADGTISFDGFWGDYELTVGGQTIDLALLKGTSLYSLVVAPGDYNGDGTVDAADYVVWRSAVGTSDLRADGNGDTMIDDLDYAVWRDNFGAVTGGAGGSASAVVPEPESYIALTLAILGLWYCQPTYILFGRISEMSMKPCPCKNSGNGLNRST